MKLKLENSSRHHQLGVDTLNFTPVDDAGVPIPGASQVSINAPAGAISLPGVPKTAIYQLEITEVE